MFIFNLQGGDASTLVGGTAILIFLLINMTRFKSKTTRRIIDGIQFGFKVFGPVIPIVAFFYLEDAGFTTIIGDFLPEVSTGIVNDLGIALANAVPLTAEIGAVT